MATNKRNPDGKDAIKLLEVDHAKVRKLLRELEGTTARGVKKREELLLEIAQEIRTHATIEEEIFYPAYREKARTQEDSKLYFEAEEEHGLVHVFLPTLEDTDPAAEEFGAKAKVLKDLIEHHAEEEEEEMLPRARKLLGKERLLELGAEMEARKRTLKTTGGSASSRRTGREASVLRRSAF